MFDKEDFKEYVRPKSGASYVAGLVSIEKIYGVDINTEFQKDNCSAILGEVESDKRNSQLNATERKKRSDMTSHLKKYIEYKKNIVYTTDGKLRKELYEALDEIDLSDVNPYDKTEKDLSIMYDKNMILYGPPGTGKTYSSAIYD